MAAGAPGIRPVHARRLSAARALAATCAVAAAAVGVAGCGLGGDEGLTGGGKVVGRTVTVYSVLDAPASGRSRQLVDGEKLALADADGRAGRLAVNFASLDLGSSDEDAGNAVRRAVKDTQTIAVIASATPVTVPLFNAAGLLQVAVAGDLGLRADPRLEPAAVPTLVAPRGALPADFAARFRVRFGRAPGSGATAGYRAMRGILDLVARAGAKGNDRRAVRALGAGAT